MAARGAHETVQITIDGVKYNVSPGINSLREIVAQTKINSRVAKLTVTSAPVPAGTINGNDSYAIVGGEVMTSTIGA